MRAQTAPARCSTARAGARQWIRAWLARHGGRWRNAVASPPSLGWAAGGLARCALVGCMLLAGGPAMAAEMAPPTGLAAATLTPAMAAPADPPASIELNHRRIVELRARLLDDTPQQRAELAQQALALVLAQPGPGQVSRSPVGEAVRFQVDGQTVFYLLPADVPGARGSLLLEAAARQAEHRLQQAVREARELSDPRRLAIGAATAAAATLAAWLLAWGLLRLRRRLVRRLDAALARWQRRHTDASLVATYGRHAHAGVRLAAQVFTWTGLALLAELWAGFVLRQFAYTRPWGERATLWLLDLLRQFALGIARAVPGLLTAALIFGLAWGLTRLVGHLLRRVESGELQLAWLDMDTAGPTRRLGNFVVWLFALAIAYPYLPGAESESFKGVTVLAGLMLSLGASGAVGQAMSGLSLMYSRSLRLGEYVTIGGVEGTVAHIGLFSTRLHTGLGEEVSLPNTAIASQPVRNFSRLVADGRFVLHTAITVGYGTPWRQVHQMLLEAARRTPGVAAEPAPYVVQTALSDFYVEYRLCAQADRSAPRRRAEAMDQLLANIQDVFKEAGVAMVSPHYVADPPVLQPARPGA